MSLSILMKKLTKIENRLNTKSFRRVSKIVLNVTSFKDQEKVQEIPFSIFRPAPVNKYFVP